MIMNIPNGDSCLRDPLRLARQEDSPREHSRWISKQQILSRIERLRVFLVEMTPCQRDPFHSAHFWYSWANARCPSPVLAVAASGQSNADGLGYCSPYRSVIACHWWQIPISLGKGMEVEKSLTIPSLTSNSQILPSWWVHLFSLTRRLGDVICCPYSTTYCMHSKWPPCSWPQ